jgi:hypothetical protein
MPLPPQFQGKAVPINKQPNQRKGAGRKPKLPKKWLKSSGIGKKDARTLLENLFVGKTLAQVEDLLKSEYDQVSAMTFAFITGIIGAARQGDFKTTKDILEFIWGKEETAAAPVQNTQLVDLKVLILNHAGTSPETRKGIIAELERITGYEE